MSKKTEQKVVILDCSYSYLKDLQEKIQDLLNEGYELVEGLKIIQAVYDKDFERIDEPRFIQMMIKK